jgi:hypothetical protein
MNCWIGAKPGRHHQHPCARDHANPQDLDPRERPQRGLIEPQLEAPPRPP